MKIGYFENWGWMKKVHFMFQCGPPRRSAYFYGRYR